MKNTVVYKFLELLFQNDEECCTEIWVELGEQEHISLEEFFRENQELWNWIVKYNGVPFDGEEEEYDRIIATIEHTEMSAEVEYGYGTYHKILEMC